MIGTFQHQVIAGDLLSIQRPKSIFSLSKPKHVLTNNLMPYAQRPGAPNTRVFHLVLPKILMAGGIPQKENPTCSDVVHMCENVQKMRKLENNPPPPPRCLALKSLWLPARFGHGNCPVPLGPWRHCKACEACEATENGRCVLRMFLG